MSGPVILTCAITGSIHTPSMSPHLPVTAQDIGDQAIGAAEAGASILHLHARVPGTGAPSGSPEHYAQYLPRVHGACDAVLNMTTGGNAMMTVEERLAGPLAFEPEMCSLNMGSMTFALYPVLDRIRTFKFDWERDFLAGSEDMIFRNTPRDIARILHEMGEVRGARFEFECYDSGHLDMLRHFVDRGLVKPPYFIQFVFGVLGGMAPDPETLVFMKRRADRLFGSDYLFSVLGAGKAQFPMATLSASMGGHVRVGLEDNLYLGRGQLARSNAEQVEKMRGILAGFDRPVATPAETRAMLGLKGADRVKL